MFNYGTKWNQELDSEVKLGVSSGWSANRIAENIGKTQRQVEYRIKALNKIEADKRKQEKILASIGGLFNADGSVNYTSYLKLGE